MSSVDIQRKLRATRRLKVGVVLAAIYSFDLLTNEILTERIKSPNAGAEHNFVAYRLKTQSSKTVKMISQDQVFAEMELEQRKAEKQ